MNRQYTIRGIDQKLDRAIREAAAKYGVSVNKASVTLLRKATGLEETAEHDRRGPPYHDLDGLAGTLDAAEGIKLLGTLGHARRVDPELWKNS